MATTSSSSQYRIGSGRGSSLFPHTKEGGGPKGDELEDELMFDVDVYLQSDDANELSPGTSRHNTHRLRFSLCQVG